MMTPGTLLFFLSLLSLTAYYLGLRRSVAIAGGRHKIHQLHSRPAYYGILTALWCGIPALIVFACWQTFENNIITHLVVSGLPPELQSLPQARVNLRDLQIRQQLCRYRFTCGRTARNVLLLSAHRPPRWLY
jgi:phosphate transport system permease protein